MQNKGTTNYKMNDKNTNYVQRKKPRKKLVKSKKEGQKERNEETNKLKSMKK